MAAQCLTAQQPCRKNQTAQEEGADTRQPAINAQSTKSTGHAVAAPRQQNEPTNRTM
jgi:hypothetical protein